MTRAQAKLVEDRAWVEWLLEQERGMVRRQVTTPEAREHMRVSARLRRKAAAWEEAKRAPEAPV